MDATFISFAKIRLYFTPFSGQWATRKWMFCRKIFRAAVEPFEVNFVDVTEVQQILSGRSGVRNTAARMGMMGMSGILSSVLLI
jgi:hypothetical protein